MKLTVNRADRVLEGAVMELDAFCDVWGLEVEVNERPSICSHGPTGAPLPRWWARIGNAEFKYGSSGLSMASGDGGDPDEAIAELAAEMSGRMMVLNASSRERRLEIHVPQLACSLSLVYGAGGQVAGYVRR